VKRDKELAKAFRKTFVELGRTQAINEVFVSFQSAVSNQQLAKMDSDDCFITVEEFRLAKKRFGAKP
jgi:hypothetical protein